MFLFLFTVIPGLPPDAPRAWLPVKLAFFPYELIANSRQISLRARLPVMT